MQSLLDEFLAWVALTAQTALAGTLEIFLQAVTSAVQLKVIVAVEIPHFIQQITLPELLAASGLLLILLGIKYRLFYRGALFYGSGLGSLVLGLLNLVNPAVLPRLLRM